MRMTAATILFGGLLTMSAAETKDEKKFLDNYSGQSVEQLLAMKSEYRIDSLVLAFEQAIQKRKDKKQALSQVETDILAVEAMEREVNNGGYHQFFLNSSGEYAGILPGALERIGCPLAAKMAKEALGHLKIEGEITKDKIDTALDRLGDKLEKDLGKIDVRYYENTEPIAEKLFAYIAANKNKVSLKTIPNKPSEATR